MGSLGLTEMVVCAAVTLAFPVRGAIGFGAATVAIPIMAFAVPVTLAVSLVSLLLVLTAPPPVFWDFEKVAWPEVLKTRPFSVIGVAIGLALFSNSGDAFLLCSLGVVIITYGWVGLLHMGPAWQGGVRWRTGAAALAGLGCGCLGAVYGTDSLARRGIGALDGLRHFAYN